MDKLFEKVTLKNGTVIKNRFVKSSMNEAMGKRNFGPMDEIVNLYSLWAEGGIGLILTGNVMVDPKGIAEPGNIVFDKNTDMDLLKRRAKEGQKNGAKVFVQINHPGKQSPKTISKEPVAPSRIPVGGNMGNLFNTPRALNIIEIKDLIKKFAKAAEISKDAGFSGVEIHAAHGYLINQFLSPFDNQRKDQYGGSITNRMRFLKEVYQAMRDKVGYNFPIGIKINSTDFREGGFSEKDSIFVVKEMDKLGIDFIEVSGGNYENPKMTQETHKENDEIFFAEYCKKIKPFIKAPIIVTGGIRSIESMETIIDDNIADLIGIARPFAMDPFIVNEIKDGVYKTLETKRVTTGIKSIDKKLGSLLGLVYYQMLMKDYARGKKVKLSTNAWPALIEALQKQGLAAVFPQRVRK